MKQGHIEKMDGWTDTGKIKKKVKNHTMQCANTGKKMRYEWM